MQYHDGMRRVATPVLSRRTVPTQTHHNGELAGFSLIEISQIFWEKGAAALPCDTLRQRTEEITWQIQELTALRDTLRHVADCSAASHLSCPTFRRLLKLLANAVRKRQPRDEDQRIHGFARCVGIWPAPEACSFARRSLKARSRPSPGGSTLRLLEPTPPGLRHFLSLLQRLGPHR